MLYIRQIEASNDGDYCEIKEIDNKNANLFTRRSRREQKEVVETFIFPKKKVSKELFNELTSSID